MSDFSQTSSRTYRQFEPGYVRTELLQRRYSGKVPWWREAVVNEVAGIIDVTGAKLLEDCVFFIARMGFTALLFRPANLDIDTDSEPLRNLIAAAHRVGLKVMVRVCGANPDNSAAGEANSSHFYGFEKDFATVVRRARIALNCGADGIDLGRIEDISSHYGSLETEFTSLSRQLLVELTEYSEDHILGASSSISQAGSYQRYVEETWVHHLCDDGLQKVRFNAAEIEAAVREKISIHDKAGSVCTWRPALLRLHHSLATVNFFPGSWEDGADEARRASMRLQVAALPGAIYLPFGFSGGHFTFEGANIRPFPPQTELDKARVAHTTMILRMRGQHHLATSAFGVVTNLPWATRDCLVLSAGPIMSVLNTGSEPVYVPGEHELLLRSDSTRQEDSPVARVLFAGEDLQVTHAGKEATEISPGTCAWFVS
ncbi:hypothetical protein NXS08_01705 [Gleimia sp. 6138-11-ORH1]|uniref:hypothetical protein n=1 Tax=Gleimia sp. 6138-11-ORH1 TaxID=2973937 RepID=UPI00216839D2|nr:hypothetical protein [Gleimia sp. 6138-11-ORH1]MCS4484208.1 hypothetical protein [Gleimia sp. 6138-11-ORH1]